MRTVGLAVVVSLALGAGSVVAGPTDDAGAAVVVATKDGMKLAATRWDSTEPSPAGVVLVPMEKTDRAAWAPLVEHLRARGLAVLAVDPRGVGGSAKQTTGGNLPQRVDKRDPALFAKMSEDAIAGVRHLAKDGKCDPKRIAVIGAGVGGAVAFDAATKWPNEIAAVAWISPVADHPGLDALAAAKTFAAEKPLLLLVHETERAAGAQAIHDALPKSSLVEYADVAPASAKSDGAAWAHGTKMLGRVPLVEQTLASFVAARTGSKKDDVVLDGVVADEAADGGSWTRASKVECAGLVEGWAYRVGMRVQFGGRVKGKARAVFVGMATHFVKGTFPGFATDESAGMPEVAAIDSQTGAFAWVEPIDSSRDRNSKQYAHRVRPSVRVTKTDDGFAFEGEWISDFGEDGRGNHLPPEAIDLAFVAHTDVPPRPKEIAPGALEIPLDWKAAPVTAR